MKQKNQPKISVITICLNSEKTIARTLRSVRKQTYSNVEHIIVDGVSRDKTLDIIESLKIKNSVVISEKDSGIADAFNKGLNLATGDIIGFLNSDDEFHSENVLSRIALEYTNGSDVVCANILYHKFNGAADIIKSKPNKIKLGMYICHPTLYISKKIAETVGMFNTLYKIAMDYEYTLRATMVSTNIKYIDEIFVDMYDGGASSNSTAAAKEELRVKNKILGRKINHYIYFAVNFLLGSIKKKIYG